MKKKIIISQPLRGKTDTEIFYTRATALEVLNKHNYEVIGSFYWYDVNDLLANGVQQPSVYLLGKVIQQMANCDAVYFCKGWEQARGCQIEHKIAELYNLEMLFEEDITNRG